MGHFLIIGAAEESVNAPSYEILLQNPQKYGTVPVDPAVPSPVDGSGKIGDAGRDQGILQGVPSPVDGSGKIVPRSTTVLPPLRRSAPAGTGAGKKFSVPP